MRRILNIELLLLCLLACGVPQSADDVSAGVLRERLAPVLDHIYARLDAVEKQAEDLNIGKIDREKLMAARRLFDAGNTLLALEEAQKIYAAVASLEHRVTGARADSRFGSFPSFYDENNPAHQDRVQKLKTRLTEIQLPECARALAEVALLEARLKAQTAMAWVESEVPRGAWIYYGEAVGHCDYAEAIADSFEDIPSAETPVSNESITVILDATDRRLIAFVREHGYQRQKHSLIVTGNTFIETSRRLLKAGFRTGARYLAMKSIVDSTLLTDESSRTETPAADLEARIDDLARRTTDRASLAALFIERANQTLRENPEWSKAIVKMLESLTEREPVE